MNCAQINLIEAMKNLRNLPLGLKEHLDSSEEELIWAVSVATIGIPAEPSISEMKFYERQCEARVRKLNDAEGQYKWFTLQWTKPLIQKLLNNWFCGMLVIVPGLATTSGSPIQFVHEYYGESSGYPKKEDQTQEWVKESIDLYVLMARSTCKAYPNATLKGITSFSDMQDFDWEKYDMSSKERNANIGALIPNKLARMITFNPDEKMRKFYDDMTESARKKWGFAQYDNYTSAVESEKELPRELPTFVGGTLEVDILDCLKYLFRREEDALALLIETHKEMVEMGTLPCPRHMLNSSYVP